MDLMGCLDAPSLCRVACVSRALYVFSHVDDLWKGLLLQASVFLLASFDDPRTRESILELFVL